MNQRRWKVRPDEYGVVSQDAFLKALIDGGIVMHRLGGVLMVVQGRAPTDLEGEMVTTEVIVTWQDRATGGAVRHEQPVDVTPVENPVAAAGDNGNEPEDVEVVAEPVDEPVDDDVRARALQEA